MATKSLDEDFFMQNAVDEEAWKCLSQEENWSEALLEKYRYRGKIDWKELSKNQNMLWTIPILEKFRERLDWHTLSYNAEGSMLTIELIEKFKEEWDWYQLSRNISLQLTDEMLQKFADKWVWSVIINRHQYRENLYANKGIDFYDRYKDYIPIDDNFRRSKLWTEIIKQRTSQILSEIIA